MVPWFEAVADPSYQPNVKVGPTAVDPETRSKLKVYEPGPETVCVAPIPVMVHPPGVDWSRITGVICCPAISRVVPVPPA